MKLLYVCEQRPNERFKEDDSMTIAEWWMRAWDSFADGDEEICCEQRSTHLNSIHTRAVTVQRHVDEENTHLHKHTETDTQRRVTNVLMTQREGPQWKSRFKEFFSRSWIIHEAMQDARFTSALSQRDSWVQLQRTTADEPTHNTLEHANTAKTLDQLTWHIYLLFTWLHLSKSTNLSCHQSYYKKNLKYFFLFNGKCNMHLICMQCLIVVKSCGIKYNPIRTEEARLQEVKVSLR